jgi:hypothetical protein
MNRVSTSARVAFMLALLIAFCSGCGKEPSSEAKTAQRTPSAPASASVQPPDQATINRNGTAVVIPSTTTTEQTPVPEVKNEKHEVAPLRRSIWRENNEVFIGDDSHELKSSISLARFDLDIKTKSCTPAAAIMPSRMEGSGDPVLPVVMYLHSPGGISVSFQYTNVLMDFGSSNKAGSHTIYVGQVVTSDTFEQCAVIALTAGASSKLYVSPEYVIYDGGPPTKHVKDSHFASVKFLIPRSPADTGMADNANLIVARNGIEIKRMKMAQVENQVIELTHVKASDDLLEWSLIGGKQTLSGVLSFPVTGVVPGLVEYDVSVGSGKADIAK